MKLNKLVIGGGVLVVLLSMLVVGCKQNQELSVEEHREGENKYQHVWEAEYEGSNYYRSALQFGSGKWDLEKAQVRVKMNFPANGKAGVLFAVNERDNEKIVGGNKEKKKVYDFYAFAFGKKPGVGNEKKLELYVDYYVGLEKFNDSSATSEKFGAVTPIEVVKPTELTGTNWDGATTFSADMIIEKVVEGESVTYNLKIQSIDGKTVYWHQDGVVATGDNVVNKGYLCSYGMLSGVSSSRKVDTTWALDEESFKKEGVDSLLSAEDAE